MDFQTTKQLVLHFIKKELVEEGGNMQLKAILNQLSTFVEENKMNFHY